MIFDVSSNTGYKTGGMNLTVTGHGFNSENIVATVDGVACEVTDVADFSFSCLTASSAAVSDLTTSYQGSYGLRR